MKKTNILYILGVVLIAVSAALLVTNKNKTDQLHTDTANVTAQIQQMLPSRTQGFTGQHTYAEMPVLEIDGVDYCALLEVSGAAAVLPVANSWDKAETATARYIGSAYDGTMTIGGQNLGFLTQLDLGNRITLVDMLGSEFNYTVERIDRVKELTAEKLETAEYQLTLFSYVSKEKKYVVVRCAM